MGSFIYLRNPKTGNVAGRSHFQQKVFACVSGWNRGSQVAVSKGSACNMGYSGGVGSILGLGRSPGGGHGNPF